MSIRKVKWKSGTTKITTYWMSSDWEGTSSSCRFTATIALYLAASSYKKHKPYIKLIINWWFFMPGIINIKVIFSQKRR